MKMTVSIDEVEHEVAMKTVDLAAALKRYKKPWDQVLESAEMAEALLFVSWNACKRKGLTELTFEEWLEADVDVETKAETGPDPLGSSKPS